jgi:antitoxin MazE
VWGTEVEPEVENEMIVIRSAARPRKGWAEKFRLMSEGGDDKIIDEGGNIQNEWDKDEWEWSC